MTGVIEALHVYDDSRTPLLSHVFTGRPLSATHLLPLYLDHPPPRPSLVYLPNASPPTLVFGLVHANLLLLATSSADMEPLLALEFLHRVVDALEDFLGAPLLASKVENNYDVVAQLLTEMCDAGTVCTTEPNALREVVEMEGWVGKLLGSMNLAGKPPLGNSFAASPLPSLTSTTAPAVPWRRANVRHTSNELYADIVETLSVTLAPSGRPLAAFANGTIAFTAKVSGLPDVTVCLTSPAGKHNIASVVELPVFHPCVRLNRWRERPGELSFVPPDGRFTLAGYEVDLLPFTGAVKGGGSLKLPVELEMRTGLGPAGAEFEVRVQVNKFLLGGSGATANSSQFGGGAAGRLGAPQPGSPGAPLLDELRIMLPLPEGVRNVSDVRPSKGDASFNPSERILEWHVPSKEMSGPTCQAGLRCTVVGPPTEEDEEEDEKRHEEEDEGDEDGPRRASGLDDGYGGRYQASLAEAEGDEQETRRAAQNKILMPSSASASFSVRGWLASGLKVESIAVDTRSRGLGEGVKPYKGVKYLTVSKGGVEIRC
ncbi:AP-3 adaptor complex subunit mu [Ophiocordyceps camponoti-floridani]|uniref:AP-3 adaptor complex subunit mu n=1 Tax=Ophiocordyceps camponoti-floridani TaxID=2030778 RepID=A0A8H4Q9T1_9HYPO|nr:AP-3 adaptor complex subunit mu [Ophiocordyceps camponoti-floridani]